MSLVPLPRMVAIPKIGVVEKTRWWTSAIRRHFPSWQLQVTEFNDLKVITPDTCQHHQLWIIDLNYDDQASTEIVSLVYAQQKLPDTLLILPESRSHLACRFQAIGAGRIVISPHQETELIQWIKQHSVLPQNRVFPNQDEPLKQ